MRIYPALYAVLRLFILGFVMVLRMDANGDDLMPVTGVTRSGNTVQIDFTSRPGVTGLVVKGSADLVSWPDNLTGVSTITETSPGVYRAVVDVTGKPVGKYFIQVGGTLPPLNTAPSLVAPGDREIAPGAAFSTTVFATDPDAGDVLTFSLLTGPEGMTLDSATGRLEWTPAADDMGTKPVVVKVQDKAGASDTGGFSIKLTIWPGPPVVRHAPVLTLPADAVVTAGTAWTATASATDADAGDTVTFTLLAGPPGLMLDSGTGEMAWTPAPALAGQHAVTIQAQDQTGLADTGTFSLTVKLINQAPTAVDDVYITPKGETTTVAAPGVMTNDSDPDGNPLTAALVDDVKRGTLNFRTDGSFDYRPGSPGIQAKYAYGFHVLNNGNYKVNTGTMPVAADLNGDGRPEIVTVGQVNSGIGNTGWLVAMTYDDVKKTLVPLWSYKGGVGSAISIYNAPDPAIGDVNGDGKPEVVVNGQCKGEILIFSNTGELLVNTQADKSVGPGTQGGADCYVGGSHPPSVIADLNGDGAAEIITQYRGNNLRVYNGSGGVVWERPATGVEINNISAGPLVADIDLDGKPNIFYAGILFDAEGNTVWTLPGVRSNYGDRFVAVANLDDDPFGEIVIFTGRNPNTLRVIEHDGSCKWGAVNSTTPLTGCGTPKPFPNANGPDERNLLIADINGDGLPEIVACSAENTYNHVTVFSRDGNILWQVQATLGGNVMGSINIAAFDFDGDGIMEIVVSGRRGTTFLSGLDGSTEFEIPADDLNPGALVANDELDPIVIDVENDGHAELIIASRDSSLSSPNTGIFVYKDVNDRWMPTRPVWNQSKYAITNVNPDSSIPRKPAVNWLTPGLNNFRVNVPAPEEPGGRDSFTYRVSDGDLTSNLATVTLEIRRKNNPPVILSKPPLVATPDSLWRYQIYATDPDPGDAVTVSLQRGPAGMVLDADNVLRWTPTDGARGEHTVIVGARDRREDALTVQTFTLRVTDPQLVPDVTGQPRAAALTALETAGFTGGRVTQEDHPTVASGSVISQAPPGGAAAAPGAAVALVISTGPGPRHTDADGDGYTPFQGDCNDGNAAVHPGAADPPGDGIDQDCDGIDGNLVLASIVVEPASGRILTGSVVPLTATGVFTDGTSQNLTAVVAWSSRGPRFSSATAGTFPVTATLGAISGTTSITVVDRVADDDAPPVAEILSPVAGATVTGPVEVRGSAQDSNLLKYELAYAVAGSGAFTTVKMATDPVSNGVLGTFDPTMLMNDQYTIRLTVYDRGGNESVAETTVLVDENMKVGNFSLTFTDLQIPMANLPITISRIYDSRDWKTGEFGVGWRIGVKSVSIRANRVPGTAWNVFKRGVSFALQAREAHTVTVSLPDGTVETFDVVVSPQVSPIVAFPPSALRARFEARPGTLGHLESLENNPLTIFGPQPGPVELLDDVTLDPFNPQRFRYTARDGTVMILHLTEGIQSLTDPAGNTLVFTRLGIFHSSGKSVLFTRDSLDRIIAVTDPRGNVQRYGYDGNGDLRRHTDASGNVTSFKYNRYHGLIELIDPLGNRAVRSEYDASGRLSAVVDAAGHRTTFVHNIEGRETVETDARGNIQRLIYDQKGNVLTRERTVTIEGTPVVALERFEYDERGNATLKVDADGVRTQFEYDARDNLVRTVLDPGGLNITTSTTYDDKDNPVTRTDPLGQVSTYAYDSCSLPVSVTDPLGNTHRYTYDRTGRLVAREDPEGTVVSSRFNSSGLVISQDTTDVSGRLLNRTDFSYDNNGNETGRTTFREENGVLIPFSTQSAWNANNQLISVTDPLGNVTRSEYNAARKVSAKIDANGKRTTFTYDPRGLLVTTTRADGMSAAINYDPVGRVTENIDAAGRKTTYSYDELGRKVSTTRADNSTVREIFSPAGRVIASIDAGGRRTDYTYDAAGRRIRTTQPEVVDGRTGLPVRPVTVETFDAAGRRTSTVDPNGSATTFTYDAGGRLTKTTFADGTFVSRTYDRASRVRSSTDELGRVTLYTYDGLGKLTSVTQPPAGPGAAVPVTSFSYDMTGNLVSRTDALGRITRFRYDAVGRQIRKILPSGQFAAVAFDPAGNVISQQDFNGLSTVSTYDSVNRVLSSTFSDGTSLSYTYNPSGTVASAADPSGTITYSYDSMDRVLSQKAVDGTVLTYTYGPDGRQSTITTPSQTVSYQYDGAGRLDRITSSAGTIRYLRDPRGNQTGIVRPNGATTVQTFDSMNRIAALVHKAPDGSVLESFSYTFHPNGRRQSVTESDGSVETYAYDGLDRLIAEQRTGTQPRTLAHTYDLAGNRVAFSRNGIVETAEFDINDRLLRAGSAVFTYDGNGNRTSRKDGGNATVYEWDARDRMILVRKGSAETHYSYGPNGNRIAESGPVGPRRFVVDAQNITGFPQVVEERDTGGSLLAGFVYGTSLLHRSANSERYYHADAHGNTRLLTTGNGALTDRFDYESFGALTNSAAGSAQGHLFCGEQRDAATGFYYLRARYYDPATGLFISRDPAEGNVLQPVTLQPYLYAAMDPVNLVDPSGRTTGAELSIVQGIQNTMRVFEVSPACAAKNGADIAITAIALTQLAGIALAATLEFSSFNSWGDQELKILNYKRKGGRPIEEFAVSYKPRSTISLSGTFVTRSEGEIPVALDYDFASGALTGEAGFDVPLFSISAGCGVVELLEVLLEVRISGTRDLIGVDKGKGGVAFKTAFGIEGPGKTFKNSIPFFAIEFGSDSKLGLGGYSNPW